MEEFPDSYETKEDYVKMQSISMLQKEFCHLDLRQQQRKCAEQEEEEDTHISQIFVFSCCLATVYISQGSSLITQGGTDSRQKSLHGVTMILTMYVDG